MKKLQTSNEETVRLDYILSQIDAVYHKASVKSSLSDSESWISVFKESAVKLKFCLSAVNQFHSCLIYSPAPGGLHSAYAVTLSP
ncbi:hypothetical protein [Treponema succinifaciens]|uniref:hypothetical protein n=1 Tax=Treponema succinifaciens TaxID=167 RepID=UPI003FCE9B38